MTTVTFTVPGRAQPGGSKTAYIRGGHAIVTDANRKAAPWKERVALVAAEAWAGAPLLDEALGFRLYVSLVRPRGHFNSKGELNKKGRETPWPISKPDVLKYARPVEDCLKGIVYVDDARIVRETLSKDWGERDEVTVEIRTL